MGRKELKRTMRNGHAEEVFLATTELGTQNESNKKPRPGWIMKTYRRLFRKELPHKLPEHKGVEHRIPLKDPSANPVYKGLYKMAKLELDALKGQLDALVQSRKIEPSESPWGALVLFVKKKDRS